MGMYLMRQIGTRGVYGNPLLPDFMVFLNWQKLPWFWWGFDHFAWAAAMVILVPGLLALVFGWLAFRSRVTGVYLSIITQAMTYALMLAFFRNDMGFGGNNGMTDYKDILGWDVHQPVDPARPLPRFGRRSRARLSAVPLHHLLQARSRPVGSARCRKPGALSRLFGDQCETVRLHGLGGACGHRGRALCPASRYHQPQRILAWKFDRDRDLGLGRRAGHLIGSDRRRPPRQRGENLADRRRPRNLALRARRPVCADDTRHFREGSSDCCGRPAGSGRERPLRVPAGEQA